MFAMRLAIAKHYFGAIAIDLIPTLTVTYLVVGGGVAYRHCTWKDYLFIIPHACHMNCKWMEGSYVASSYARAIL